MSMKEDENKFIIEILMPEVNYYARNIQVSLFKEIDLDVSTNLLKLKVQDKYNLEYAFEQKVDPNSIQAKWDKKTKKLKLEVEKLK